MEFPLCHWKGSESQLPEEEELGHGDLEGSGKASWRRRSCTWNLEKGRHKQKQSKKSISGMGAAGGKG